MRGAAGAGKTTLVRGAIRATGVSAVWVSGTETAKSVPLGAFSHLIEVGSREPHAVVAVARRRFAGTDILVVDDAHLLDPLSATVVAALATERGRVVLALRPEKQLPQAIGSLLDQLDTVELAALTRGEVGEIVEAVVGGPVESLSVDRLHDVSQGNPLFLRHLVDGALYEQTLRPAAGVWQLRGDLVLTPRLSSLLAAQLAGLDAPTLEVLELLAFGGPLPLAVLGSLRGDEILGAAMESDLVRIAGDVAALRHPVYGEVVRARTGVLRARRIRGELVAAAPPPVNASERIRVVGLAVDSDRPPDLGALLSAAGDAVTLGDLQLGETFARRALELGGGFRASMVLAQALAWQGRGTEAEAVLAAVDADSLGELVLLAWATTRATNLYWIVADAAGASAVLAKVAARLRIPIAIDFVAMFRAAFEGQYHDALDAARRVVDSPQANPVLRGWAAFVVATSYAHFGRLDDVAAVIFDGLTEAARSESGQLRFNLGLAEVSAALAAGRFDDAATAAQRYVDMAVGQPQARAKAGVLLGMVLAAQGRFVTARDELTESLAGIQGIGYSWEFLAAVQLCQVHAQLGDAEAAALALARAEALVDGNRALFGADFALAQAWVAAARKLDGAAVAHARQAAALAAQTGRATVEAAALHVAVRLGDRGAAGRLAELAEVVDGTLVRLQARHALALASGKIDELRSVAAEFDAIGAAPAAAAARAQTARRSPRLTAREREIAALVALGLSNKQIADRMSVSVRTVEGHIYRSCIKLDVVGRAELSRAVLDRI